MNATKTFKHGRSAYYYHGCRCDVCVTANREDHRVFRARARSANPERNPALKHGSSGTYGNHGCRCGPCTHANSEKSALRRRRAAP